MREKERGDRRKGEHYVCEALQRCIVLLTFNTIVFSFVTLYDIHCDLRMTVSDHNRSENYADFTCITVRSMGRRETNELGTYSEPQILAWASRTGDRRAINPDRARGVRIAETNPLSHSEMLSTSMCEKWSDE